MSFGKTDVSIGMGCLSTTLIQHEIIHALGMLGLFYTPKFIKVGYDPSNPP